MRAFWVSNPCFEEPLMEKPKPTAAPRPPNTPQQFLCPILMLLLSNHPPPLGPAGSDAKHSPELLEVDSSRESGAAPPGGAYSDAEVRKGAVPERLVLSFPCHLSFLWGLHEPICVCTPCVCCLATHTKNSSPKEL